MGAQSDPGLTQTIIRLSGSMSQVLEVVKSINTQNEWRIQGHFDMDRELENEQGGGVQEGIHTGEV